MSGHVDRKLLKETVKEILLEDVGLLKTLLKELLVENQVIVSNEQLARRERVEAMINEDFEKYDIVFKDLA